MGTRSVKPFTAISRMALVCSLCACTGAGQRPAAHAEQEARPRGAQLVEIAKLLSQGGDRVRAAQYLTLAQRDGVPPRSVLRRLLALYAADGQYRLAIDAAEMYLEGHPNDRAVRRCLGAFYVAVDATSDAVHVFEELVHEAPDDSEAHFALASLLKEVRAQRARADEHYRRYLALAPHGHHAEEARAGLSKELLP